MCIIFLLTISCVDYGIRIRYYVTHGDYNDLKVYIFYMFLKKQHINFIYYVGQNGNYYEQNI